MAKKDDLLEYLTQGKGPQIPNVYKAIYGYELTYPGYADIAIKAMELTEPKNAREEYEKWVADYEKGYDAMMKNVAEWYDNYLERRNTEKWKSKIKSLSIQELMTLKRNLLDEDMKNGKMAASN